MKKTAVAAAGMVILGAVMAFNSGGSETPNLRIGIMLCLSGECAEWGRNSLNGARLAAEEVNAAGGVNGRKVELVVEDSGDSQPATTAAAYRKLALQPGVHFIVGPTWTVGAMTVAPMIAARRDVLVISPSVGLRDFNESGDNIFNIWPHDEIATRRLAHYAIEKGWRTAGIFSSEDPWVKAQSDIFEEEYSRAGGAIVARVDPIPTSRDLRAEALKIKSASPAVVFMANYQMDSFSRELRSLKFEAPKLAILMDKDRVIAAEGALEGTVFALYEKPSPSFAAAYLKKHGVEPGITADTGYDAVKLVVSSVRDAGSERVEEVKAKLRDTRMYQGASGTFSINAKGAVDKKPVLWKVRGMEYERT